MSFSTPSVIVPLAVVLDLLRSCVAVQMDGDCVCRPAETSTGHFLAVYPGNRYLRFAERENATVEVRAAGFRLVDQVGELHDVMPMLAAPLPRV